MNKSLLTALTLTVALSATANGLSLQDRARLQSESRTRRALTAMGLAGRPQMPAPMLRTLGAEMPECLTAIVRLSDDDEARAALADEGDVSVRPLRGGFAVVTFPASRVEAVASHRAVKSFSLERPVAAKLDVARAVTGVDKIHNALELPKAYTGRGVVGGVIDMGIDPNHINFRYPNGDSRISMFSYAYTGTKGAATRVYNYLEVPNFTTDMTSSYHGTHTLGIMTGSYDGEGKMAYYDDTQAQWVLHDNCPRTPFYGVAPAMDIAAGAGAGSDALIALNMENILDYAAMVNKRAVINMSLGSSLGPHDGSAAINQYLDYISLPGEYEIDGVTYKGDNAIICISAGNEGDMPIALNKVLAKGETLTTYYKSMMDDGESDGKKYINMNMGQTYIYAPDATPFELRVVAYSRSRGLNVWNRVLTSASNTLAYVCTSDVYQSDTSDFIDTQLARYFEGYVGYGTMVDEANNRYMAVIDIALINNETRNADSDYIFGLEITNTSDDTPRRYCIYGDAGEIQGFDSYDVAGASRPDGNGTISDLACGQNQIIVGSFDTKSKWCSLDDHVYGYPEGVLNEGSITGFSSFGTLYDGRNLPHVCAPGAAIVSSASSYYVEDESNKSSSFDPASPGQQQGVVSEDSRSNYYIQMSGTSMASPLVAGSIALWLEADPTLTVFDARDIIAKTSLKDVAVAAADPVKAGAGKFDAYAGLKEVLRRVASVDDINAEADAERRLLVNPDGARAFLVALPGASRMTVTLHTVTGAKALEVSGAGDEVRVDASSLAPGVYVVTANGLLSAKVLVKD